MANPPATVVTKKRGLGCCGCGCFILGLLALLALALGAGSAYLTYNGAFKITSEVPATIPSYDGGDDVYNSTKQKMSGFNHDVQNQLAATIQLSADEINTMIAHDPDFTKNNVHAYVSLTGDLARLQVSIPTGAITSDLIKDRYLNIDVTFGIDFDPATKNINLNLKNLQLGQVTAPEKDLSLIQTEFSQILNQLLQKDPQYKSGLDRVNTIQIKDGLLVIETK